MDARQRSTTRASGPLQGADIELQTMPQDIAHMSLEEVQQVVAALHRRLGNWSGRTQGSLRIIAAVTQAEVLRKMLRHLKLAADPPPIAPARARHATCDWVASAHAIARGLRSDVRAAEGWLSSLQRFSASIEIAAMVEKPAASPRSAGASWRRWSDHGRLPVPCGASR